MARFERAPPSRKTFPNIYIFTEGKKTEPNYFEGKLRSLKNPALNVEVLPDQKNTMTLVENALAYCEKYDIDLSDPEAENECWLVFDKDSFTQFDNAIHRALSKGFKVAYSNESFEIWLILHFEYLNTSIGRASFGSKVSGHIGKKYEKNMPDLYELVAGNENKAIKFAKKLEGEYGPSSMFKDRDPSTTVYKLVERLNEMRKE